MKIAAAAYPLSWFDVFADYEAKLTAWVAEAAGQGAALLVFSRIWGDGAGLAWRCGGGGRSGGGAP